MALKFVESFDHDGTVNIPGPQQGIAKWTTMNGSFVAGRNGQGFSGQVMKSLKPGANWSSGWCVNGNPGGSPLTWQSTLFQLAAPLGTGSLATIIFEINIAADGTLVLLAGNQVIGNPSTFHFSAGVSVAIGFNVSLTAGFGGFIEVSCDLYVNSNKIFSGSALSNVGISGLLSQQALGNMFVYSSPDGFIDDIWIIDNVNGGVQPNQTYLDIGDVGIFCIYPRQDIDFQWTTLSGPSGYLMVREHPPDGDLSFIYSNTDNQIATFLYDLVPSFVGTIKGMQMSLYVRKDDEGARAFVDCGGSGSFVGLTQIFLGDTYQFFTFPYDIDPISGNALTPAIINAGDYGIKLVV